ncbi:magnesium transporter CorA family protein [Geminisphaera colitermitum]|uniref:magnesium transporter CorA family protein n=1 Tax=Geminisphaera colitermitum TaxID=1148786 RepID=UPI000158D3D2|nr:magnesium transporter CorA family protein [Geminisphaera colitermitum]
MITTLVFRDSRFAGRNPSLETLPALRQDPSVILWIDLSAPTDAEIKTIFEDLFNFHPLVIEDCTIDSPLPKLEDYEDYLYLVMHAVDYSKTDKFSTTELDLLFGKNFLVTLHRQPLRPVDLALERALKMPGQTVRGPDRFAHTLLDFMVEAYKPALDELTRDLQRIEVDVLGNAPADELFPRVVALRKELSQLRQIVKPQREVASQLAGGKWRLIRTVMIPYLRDLAEELARIEQHATAWGDQLILSFRIYLNKSSHQANEGIRVLTALTALTIPPLLIGGWYGMNFTEMQTLELHSRYAYPIFAGLTLLSVLGMAYYMRRKKWL